ncbi:MarR family winged helix-turn-helix transcriptional regulator [Actinomadura mexicana]|uniref:DNA-binding transcriptional regulator, MarR family n=1 Tax=Actinomadura mexicana TaxID=134959 RepID=A0A239E6G3_9ACTN|nr:MarR family winged helix-turn-helix transcriptional regulator [Actinomadura mexicana]SNS39474.1 DNA-binding transcriptional regulator, MarR family [Actinomadura mexicana]
MEDRPDPLCASPTYLLFETGRLVRRTSVRMFPDQPGLPYLMVLSCVARHGPLSQRQVAGRLRMDAGDLVGIVDALERAGHVQRRRDPEDRRRYALDATENGRLFLGARQDDRASLDDALFEALSPDETHLLKGLLLRILAHHDERFAGVPEPQHRREGPGRNEEPIRQDGAGQRTGTGIASGSTASS